MISMSSVHVLTINTCTVFTGYWTSGIFECCLIKNYCFPEIQHLNSQSLKSKFLVKYNQIWR